MPVVRRTRCLHSVILWRSAYRIVRLSIDRMVVGFGQGTVLTARRDDDDQWHLEVVPWAQRP